MKKRMLFVFLAMFFLPLAVGAAGIDLNNFSYDPLPAQPGKQLTLWVNVKNNSNFNADSVSVEFVQGYPFSLQAGENARIEVGNLGAYQSTLVRFKLLVDKAAAKGDYPLNLKISDSSDFASTKQIIISVSANNPRVELIGSSETNASPGQELRLELTVKNIGGANAKNVVLKIKEDRTVTTTGAVVDRDLVPLGASSALLQNLQPNQEASVGILLAINKGATLKNYMLPVTVEYYDDNGTQFTSTGYIGLRVVADTEIDAVVSATNPKAFPGGSSEISIDVFNTGAASASYIVAEVEMENTEFSENKIFVGTLDPDDFDSFKTTAKFSDSTKPGNYLLDLKLTFKDANNETKTMQKKLPIKIVNAGEAQAGGSNPLLAIIGIMGLLLQLVGLYAVAKWVYSKAKPGFRK